MCRFKYSVDGFWHGPPHMPARYPQRLLVSHVWVRPHSGWCIEDAGTSKLIYTEKPLQPQVEWTRGSVQGALRYLREPWAGSPAAARRASEAEREENWRISWTGGQRRRGPGDQQCLMQQNKNGDGEKCFFCFIIFFVSSFRSYFFLNTYFSFLHSGICCSFIASYLF